jgi:hypothetical protein
MKSRNSRNNSRSNSRFKPKGSKGSVPSWTKKYGNPQPKLTANKGLNAKPSARSRRRMGASDPVRTPAEEGKAPVKLSGWQKFLAGLKKALGIGAKIAQFALPFFGATSANGTPGKLITCSKTGARCMQMPGAVLATPLSMAGMANPIMTQTKFGYEFIHSGLITEVQIPVGTQKGDLLYRLDLSPATLEPWLSKMSNFEKYRFKNVFISYKPTCAATETGGIVGFFEWDPDLPLTLNQGEDSVADSMAHQSAMLTSVWSPATFHYNNAEEPDEEWFVDPAGREKRLTTQGIFTLVAASDFASALSAGQLLVAYEIEFMIPEVRSAVDGTWVTYYGKSVNTAHPFGQALVALEVDYPDDLLGISKVPQNTIIKYTTNYPNTSAPLSGFQLPYGYWTVTAIIAGSDLTAAALQVQGDYKLLQYPGIPLQNTYQVVRTPQYASVNVMLFSSGIDMGSASARPTNCFWFTTTAATAVTSSWISAAYLHGHPMSSFSLPEVMTKMRTALNEIRFEQKALEEALAQKRTYREALLIPSEDSDDSEFEDIADPKTVNQQLSLNLKHYNARKLRRVNSLAGPPT